jgi:hypothetical protein
LKVTERKVRRQCRELLRTLSLARPVEPFELARRLGAHRDRPLVLVARTIPGHGAAGALVCLPHRDIVVYPNGMAHEYQAQIIYHEVMHLYLGHLDQSAGRRPPLCDQHHDAQGLGDGQQSLYGRRDEWEAETGATILSEWSAIPSPTRSVIADTTRFGATETALTRALGGRGVVV